MLITKWADIHESRFTFVSLFLSDKHVTNCYRVETIVLFDNKDKGIIRQIESMFLKQLRAAYQDFLRYNHSHELNYMSNVSPLVTINKGSLYGSNRVSSITNLCQHIAMLKLSSAHWKCNCI